MKVPCDYGTNCNWPACELSCEGRGNKSFPVNKYINPTRSRQDNIYATEIWNAAIEAAALIVQPKPHIDEERRCEDIAEQIRKLKI